MDRHCHREQQEDRRNVLGHQAMKSRLRAVGNWHEIAVLWKLRRAAIIEEGRKEPCMAEPVKLTAMAKAAG